eukprot:Hpha_TRINITY_DN28799_c0_g1::TRINITY_DN28799_c0_g1_i1::g.42464::m.42464
MAAEERLADVLRRRARETPTKVAFTCVTAEGEESISYIDAHEQAAAAARLLAAAPQGRAVLTLYEEGVGAITALFACFYQGACAVPLTAPSSFAEVDSFMPLLLQVLDDCEPAAALVSARTHKLVLDYLADRVPQLSRLHWVVTDSPSLDVPRLAVEWTPPPPPTAYDALLLLYAESRGNAPPRSLLYTHAAARAASVAYTSALELASSDIVVSVGAFVSPSVLFNGVLLCLAAGASGCLVAPSACRSSPDRWMTVCASEKATVAVVPSPIASHSEAGGGMELKSLRKVAVVA